MDTRIVQDSSVALTGEGAGATWTKIWRCAILAVIVVFALMRFLYIQADFPSGITWSGVLYTDEGWYSNAAITHNLEGRWYIEGDFNPIVNLPFGQVLQVINFKLNGMSLASARFIAALSTVLLGILIYLLMAKDNGIFISLFSVMILFSNYIIFAYSRIDLLELPMTFFVLMSIVIVYCFDARKVNVVFASSSILVLAVLTKSLAIFALPILLYIIYVKGETTRERYLLPLCASVIVATVILIYNLIVSYAFPNDYNYFNQMNFADRLSFHPLELIGSGLSAIMQAKLLDPIVYPMTLGLSFFMIIFSKDFRTNRLVHISLLWMLSFYCLLALTRYHPPRYFLPIMIPICVLLGVCFKVVNSKIENRVGTVIMMTMVVSAVLLNLLKIGICLAQPNFSFVTMTHQVEKLISDRSRNKKDVLLMGNMANSISLETGIRSINATVGTHDLMWKVGKYKPDYYVSLGIEPEAINKLEKMYKLVLIGTFDVYQNYYGGKKVLLFQLVRKMD